MMERIRESSPRFKARWPVCDRVFWILWPNDRLPHFQIDLFAASYRRPDGAWRFNLRCQQSRDLSVTNPRNVSVPHRSSPRRSWGIIPNPVAPDSGSERSTVAGAGWLIECGHPAMRADVKNREQKMGKPSGLVLRKSQDLLSLSSDRQTEHHGFSGLDKKDLGRPLDRSLCSNT